MSCSWMRGVGTLFLEVHECETELDTGCSDEKQTEYDFWIVPLEMCQMLLIWISNLYYIIV